MQPRRAILVVLMITVLALAACAGQTDATSSLPNLLVDADTPGGVKDNEPVVMRSRAVGLRFDLLDRADEFAFNFFPDAVFDARVEKRSIGGAGSSMIEGSLSGIPGSHFTLAVNDKVVTGNVTLPDGRVYQIRYTPAGVHMARQVDPSRYPKDAMPLIPSHQPN